MFDTRYDILKRIIMIVSCREMEKNESLGGFWDKAGGNQNVSAGFGIEEKKKNRV